MKKLFYLFLLIFFFFSFYLGLKFFYIQKENKSQINREKLEETEIKEQKIIPEHAKVPILVYHHIRDFLPKDSANSRTFIVPASDFANQLKYLKDNGFEAISFKNLLDYFTGDFSMPNKPIIISFDDGLINQYQNAFPLLKEYGFSATFFIFTNPIGKSENYMSWENVKELNDAGMEFGIHGHYHLYFDKISPDELDKEIVFSKQVLEEKINSMIDVIAYPFGSYNDEALNKIKKAGFFAARGITNGVIHYKDDFYDLNSYFITDDFSRFKNIVEQ